jgi:hypothetical protein
MGFTASQGSGKEELGLGVAAQGVQRNHTAETGQGVGSGAQGQRKPGKSGPFIVARGTRMDNEAATMPHPTEQRPSKGKIDTSKKSNRLRNA